MPAGLEPARADCGLRTGQVAEQTLAVFEKGAAFVGQSQPARGAQEQLDAEPGFQRVDAPAHDSRRHALGQGRRGEAAFGGHGDKGFDLLESVHGLIVPMQRHKPSLVDLDLCKRDKYSLRAGS